MERHAAVVPRHDLRWQRLMADTRKRVLLMMLSDSDIALTGDELRVGLTVNQGPATIRRSAWQLATPSGELLPERSGGEAALVRGAGILDLVFGGVGELGTYQLFSSGRPSVTIDCESSGASFAFFSEYEPPVGSPARQLLDAIGKEHERNARALGGVRRDLPDKAATGQISDPPLDPSVAEDVVRRVVLDVADGEVGLERVLLASGSFAIVVFGLGDLRAAWELFRTERPSTGLWPVVVGSLDDLEGDLTDDRRYQDKSVDEVIDSRNSHRDLTDLDPSDPPADVIAQHRFTFENYGVQNGPGGLALLPVKHGWEVFEAIAWEDGNTLPPWVHRDVAQRWEERFGAELAVIDGAVIEFFVPEPISDRAVAIAVAREHIGYGDEDGSGLTLRDVASSLLVSSIWSFWWD